MLFTSAFWDWGLTWGAVFFAPFVEFLDFMLSAMMDKAPLSIGSGVGPSNRPLLDLNLPPAPEPEPALPSELSEEEDLSLLERESKRARLDVASASSNQVAPETLSESPIVESSVIASPGSDTVSGSPVVSEQSLDQAPDSYSYLDGDLDSIHKSAGETLYNLLQQAGIQAPQSWTMPELAAEIIDSQRSISYASEVLQDLLTNQVNSFYFDQTVELIRLIMG